ncbi:MAG: RNA polymerase sigma factor [bacterium]|nr:RNA polymerase sigma factor [bacterium]
MAIRADLHELIAAAQRGDREAIGRLWVRFRRFVASVLLAHGDARELDDLMQEVALRMTRGIGQLVDPSSVRPWLRTLARRVAIDRARRQLRVVRSTDELDELAWYDAGQPRDDLDAVLTDLEHMAPTYREPLLLRAVEGLTQREIADALGLPETTVETRLARARRMLRERFESDRCGAERFAAQRTDEHESRSDASVRRAVD